MLLMNSQNLLASTGAFKEIEDGVMRLLVGQEPVPAAALSLPLLYLIVDVVLGGLFALALWPLLRMRRWEQQLRQRWLERGRLLKIAVRLGWEFGVPLTLLLGARLLLHALGAQSWAEGFLLLPDFGMWLWGISLIMLVTGITHLRHLLRMLQDSGGESRKAAIAPTSGHSV